MLINETQISKIAKLARIAVSQEEKVIFAKELSKVLDVIETLQEVNTDHIEPISSISKANLTMRTDEYQEMLDVALIMKNAPLAQYNCFAVPKVIE
jgi:aspartyl-tRNA(Asn)/glutamyl-tRNA(Gln) amidotransferase subunit C